MTDYKGKDVVEALEEVKAQKEKLEEEINIKTDLCKNSKRAQDKLITKVQEAKLQSEKQAQELSTKSEEFITLSQLHQKPNAKINKRNANAAPWHGKFVQAEGLPSGWLMGRKIRTQGKGYNKYYIQPGTGQVFKSKKGVERFLEQEVDEFELLEESPSHQNKCSLQDGQIDKCSLQDGQIDAYEEIENLRRQLRDAVNEKNKFETQYKEQLLLNNQLMKQMEELTCEKERRQDLEERVKSFNIVFASRQESMKSFIEDCKSKLDHLKA